LDGFSVLWSKGDEIRIQSSPLMMYEVSKVLDECSGSRTGLFPYQLRYHAAPVYAFYPPSLIESDKGEYLYPESNDATPIFLPSTQQYWEDSFGPGSNAAVARMERNPAGDGSGSGLFVFRNLCGLIKLQLVGSVSVSRITLTTLTQEQLCGPAEIDMKDSENWPRMVFKEQADERYHSLTLDCSGGVQLNESKPVSFFLAVPPGCLEKGFVATIWDTHDNAMQVRGAASESNSIKRSTITTMPVVTFSAGSEVEIIGSCLEIDFGSLVFMAPRLMGVRAPLDITWGDGTGGKFYQGVSHEYEQTGNYHIVIQTSGAQECEFSHLDGIRRIDFSKF